MDRSVPGRLGASLPPLDVPEQPLPSADLLRGELDLPEVSEGEVVRYFTTLSQMNFSVDTNYYPLGSCTMKYNPKINDEAARMPGFSQIHPLQPEESSAGRAEAGLPAPGLHLGDNGHGGHQPGNPCRRAGRAWRDADGACLSPLARRWASQDRSRTGQRPRHQPGLGSHVRLPGPERAKGQQRQHGPGRSERGLQRRPGWLDAHAAQHPGPLRRQHSGDMPGHPRSWRLWCTATART